MTVQATAQPSITQPGAGEAVGSVGANDRLIIPGEVYWSDGQSHDVDFIHWRSGTASAPSFTLRVGLRNLDTANGPAGRDDAGEDGNSGTHVNPASNTNFSTTLATPRTVAHGERLALVFDLSAWVSGSIRVPAGLTATTNEHGGGFATYYNGTTYTLVTTPMVPLITLDAEEGADHIYGVFVPGLPRFTATVTSVSFNSASTPDEQTLAFELVAAAVRISFGWVITTVAGGSFDIVLYSGTDVVGTRSFDANTWDADAVARWVEGSFAGDFQPGTYRLSLKPTTTTNVTISTVALTAGHLEAFGGDEAGAAYLLGSSTRSDGGAFSAPSDTTLPFLCFVDVELAGAAAAASSGGDAGIVFG